MSDIRINMTTDEAEEFEALSEEKQKEFMEGVKLRREHLMLKTAIASMFLIECFDEIEILGLQRHGLKQAGKKYNEQLEKYVTDIFKINNSNSESTEYLNVQIKAIHHLIDTFEVPKK